MNINYTKIKDLLPKDKCLIIHTSVCTKIGGVRIHTDSGICNLRWVNYSELGLVIDSPTEQKINDNQKQVAVVNGLILGPEVYWLDASDFDKDSKIHFEYIKSLDYPTDETFPENGQEVVALIKVIDHYIQKRGHVYYLYHLYKDGIDTGTYSPYSNDREHAIADYDEEGDVRIFAYVAGYRLDSTTCWIDAVTFDKTLEVLCA